MRGIELQENLIKYTNIECCPVRNVLAHFSGKWSLLILCILSENEATRYSSIRKAIPDISSKVLSDTLKNLEKDRLISKKIFPEVPLKVEYSLTELGRSLMPTIESLIEWALKNFDTFAGAWEQHQ
ncbi:MAG: helix-turn-helix transcriptional regulator [Muribaculaceae bacterium]|nr:helix-turn-helix transcriptional regulator [Muribaculaceae bacterium]